MSDQLGSAFDFSGRLSFAGRQRLERKLLLIFVAGIAGPVFLLTIGVSPPFAGVAALLLVPALIGLCAASVRRLHDVGRHAHRVYLKRSVWLLMVGAPAAAVLAIPDLPPPVLWGLVGLSGMALLSGLFIRDLIWAEWLRGEPGPNRFGPPPE